MTESIGVIGKCEDPIVTRRIEAFLKELEGFELIYITHSSRHKLYIVDNDRLKRLYGGDDFE